MAADRFSAELIGDIDDELAAARHRALFLESQDAIVLWENDRTALCNRPAIEMFGFGHEREMLGGRLGRLSPEHQPDGRRSVDVMRGIMGEVLAGGGSRRIEWLHRRADGSTFPAELAVTAVPGNSGPALYFIIRDLTEQKRLEADLQHTQKMEVLGSLAAGLAHDFNNTLVPIATYASLLEQTLDEHPEQQGWAAEIARASSLASALVKKLLAVSRREVHQRRPTTIDLVETVTASLGMLRKLVGEVVRVRFDAPPGRQWILAEHGDIDQILLNLAANARDAMPDGGLIRIAVATTELDGQDWVRLGVEDDGVGMDADTLDRIFDPFFTTKEVGAGTGLGMASVRELVHAAGGRVHIESTRGKGTTVEVLWPAAAAPAPAAHTEFEPDDAGAGRPTVLVVENDTAILRLITDVLDRAGHEVLAAGNGLRGLEAVERAHPDLVVTDVVMPHMGGPQMVRELRDRGHDTPVLFISGHVDEDILDRELGDAELDIIRKPFTADDLVAAVRRCLGSDGSDR